MDKKTELLNELLKMGLTPEDFTNAYDKEQKRRVEEAKKQEKVSKRRTTLVKALEEYLNEMAPEEKNDELVKEFEQELKSAENIMADGHTKIHFKIRDGSTNKEFHKEGNSKEVEDAFDKWLNDLLKRQKGF